MCNVAATWMGEDESIPRSFNPWDEGMVLESLNVLSGLAKEAVSQSQRMYAWQMTL
jgi:hypothetical protein